MEQRRYRFTVEEFDRMGRSNVFGECARLELIEGEIYAMTPIGERHGSRVDRLNLRLTLRLGHRAFVRVQGPIHLSEDSEPQPDLLLLRMPEERYDEAHPVPEDVFLVIEVADTTVRFDRQTKMPLYSRAGIPEFWLVDLAGDLIEVHSDPGPEGYRMIRPHRRGDTIAVGAFPDETWTVDEFLGKPPGSS